MQFVVVHLDVLSRGHQDGLLLHGHLGALGRHVVHETVGSVLAVLVEDLRHDRSFSLDCGLSRECLHTRQIETLVEQLERGKY